MNVHLTVINPQTHSFELTPHYASGRPVVRLSAEVLKPQVHGIDDEQLAVVYGTGLIERLAFIANREGRDKPFALIEIGIPGVSVDYFWFPPDGIADLPDAVASAMASALHAQGEFASFEVALDDVRRRAGIVDPNDVVA